jgi:hypothetical protein
MKTEQSATGTPDDSSGLGGGAESSGSGATGAHQDSPTGFGVLSDSVSLGNDVSQAYAGFDPAQHAVGADGKPLMRKGGGFQRKRGRKAGTPATGTAQSSPAVNGENPAVQMTPEQGAVFIVATTSAICHAVFGDEAWKITDKAEFKGHTDAVRAYLEATGGMNLSPGWGLVAAGATYSLPRLQSEPTQTRLSKWAGWIKGKFSRSK